MAFFEPCRNRLPVLGVGYCFYMTVKNVLLGLATLFVVPSLQAQETTAIDSMVTDSLTDRKSVV